jgi:cytochrome P450
VVRFCPDAVSFITAEAWNVIYGHGHRQLPKVILSADTRKDIVTANDSDHTRYRKALSHAFSVKGLHAQEPIVSKHIDKLIERLKGFTESGLQVDMVKWYNLTTFDVIGDLAFGEPFGGLDSSEYHHWVTTVFSFVKVIPYLRAMDHYPLLFKVILAFLPRSFMEGRKRQIEHAKLTMQKRLNSPTAHGRGDFMDSMLRHRGDENELSVEELEANANFLIIAGSETTATLLSGVTYWLLQTPEALNKVTREVRSSFASEADITFSGVTVQLPYMQACLNEALRLYPPVPGGLERRTETPIQISGYKIPEQVRHWNA